MTQPLTGLEFARQLRQGPYAWPGGYPRFLVLTDGETLCFGCAKTEGARVRLAAMAPGYEGWKPLAFDVNWESPDLHCSHCDARIESAYVEDHATGKHTAKPDRTCFLCIEE